MSPLQVGFRHSFIDIDVARYNSWVSSSSHRAFIAFDYLVCHERASCRPAESKCVCATGLVGNGIDECRSTQIDHVTAYHLR